MHGLIRRLRSFLGELKRRKIFRAAAVYATVAFVVLQTAAIVFPALHLPDWTLTFLVIVAILGFPLVLALEWVFEITSEGIRRESAAEEGAKAEAVPQPAEIGAAAEAPSPVWRRPVVLAPVGLVLLLALASAWGLGLRPSDPAAGPQPVLSPTTVAVLPFSVRGDEDARYLGEGIVNLLGTALDGAGSLRTVDARATFGVLAQDGDGPPDPERGRRLATRLGAGLVVLGDIVQAGDRFHLEKAVYDAASGSAEPRVRAAVSGEADRLFELADDLAARLLAGLGEGATDRFTHTAAATTSSFPAFKAYLDGEAHIRAGRFERAAESYLEALAHDSTFAVAHYRLALVRDWAALGGALEAADAAVRQAERLTPRDRALLEAFRAWANADAVEAERRYRQILARYPDDVEAWLHLGETLFHYGPRHGRPITESEEAWRRVLAYEPRELSAALHLARIHALQGKVEALDSLLVQVASDEAAGDRRMIQIRMLRALSAGDSLTARSLLGEVRQWEEAAIWQVASYLATFSPDPAGSRRVIRELIEPGRSPALTADLHRQLAVLYLSNGRWTAALEALDTSFLRNREVSPEAYRRMFEPFMEWSVAILPLPLPDSTVVRVRRRAVSADDVLREGEGEGEARTAPALMPTLWLETFHRPEIVEAIRQYTIGRLSLRLGEPAGAAVAAGALESLAGSGASDPLVRDLDRGLRAWIARHEGRLEDALHLLEEIEIGAPGVGAWVVPFIDRVHERFLRGEILVALGREREALPWFESLGQHSVMESPLRGLAHLRRAQIYERLGDRSEATFHFNRVVELWEEGDEGFQSLVDEARRGLGELAAGFDS